MLLRAILLILLLTIPTSSLGAQDACPVQGVWQLESSSMNGQNQPLDSRSQIKLVTATHWAFIAQSEGPAELRTRGDTLQAFRTRGFGGGRYRVTDDSYTEHLDYFMNPGYVGREITFTCRVEGDLWYHQTEDFPILEDGAEATGRLAEVWRRIG
jgi:hypothetical protein